MSILNLLAMLIAGLLGIADAAEPVIPTETRQLVLAIGVDVTGSQVTLRRYGRPDADSPWEPVDEAVAARIGREGLAAGRGVHGDSLEPLAAKREGDWKAPAGVFRIGSAFGDAAEPPGDVRWPYIQVTENDLWVEDPRSEVYNHHIRLEGDRSRTAWEESQRMKMGDSAHRLKIAIQHNAAPHALPGSGSAIFFHIWRQEGEKPTSGCTAMSAESLETMLQWLEPGAFPLYVLLDRQSYLTFGPRWGLP